MNVVPLEFFPLEVPRHLIQVIDLMLPFIPEDQEHLRRQLNEFRASNLYTAPETQDFGRVAKILSTYGRGFLLEEKEWFQKVLKIWRNEEF